MTGQFEGWILDLHPTKEGILLWVKRRNGHVERVVKPFHPAFYAVIPKRTKGDPSLAHLRKILAGHEQVFSVKETRKRVNVTDPELSPVLEVRVTSPSAFKQVVEDVQRLERARLYNVDLPIVQMFLYEEGVFPLARCRFVVADPRRSRGTLRASKITPLESNEDLEYEFPELRTYWLRPRTRSGSRRPRRDERLQAVEIAPQPLSFYETPATSAPEPFVIEEPGEAATLLEMVDAIRRLDPDILLTQDGDGTWLPYLLSRASVHGITRQITLDRSSRPLARCRFEMGGDDHYFSYGAIIRRSPTQFYLRGRLHIDTTTHGGLHFRDGNIPGLVEVSRVSYVPVQRLSRITIGGALQSIQFYNAYQHDILVPPVKLNTEDFKSARTLLEADKGGHFFEPRIGIFDDVAELDFDSMYPTLMRIYNVSPESVNCKCCVTDPARRVVPEIGFHTCVRREGIVPMSLRVPLVKRLAYKHLARRGGPKARWYEWMQAALKWILVVSFGYLGFRNARFGRVEAHQAVCAYSRDFLLTSAEIARERGFRVIHGIVDSLYLQRTELVHGGAGSSRGSIRFDPEFDEQCHAICTAVHAATKLSISYDGRFKFIVFMPSRASDRVPTLNHYWGKKTSGEIKVRGIEVRRRDAPAIVKRAQRDLMELLGTADCRDEFFALLPAADRLVAKYKHQLETGDVGVEELLVTNRVSKAPGEYKVNSYQAIAAKQLQRRGVTVSPGQKVQYVITNAAAAFPSKRVIVGDAYERQQARYDARKYVELIERAYQNLVPFDLAGYRQDRDQARGLLRWVEQ